ncbi:MAG TPA: HDIG domain-containing protein [Desulfonatronum sp.]|nr:HDIG domain-containing protein [Desulfonatronum sp.]
MLSRERAWELLAGQGQEPHMLHHALETEAVMRGLARRLGEDEDLWGVTGLLHDLDYHETKEIPEEHAMRTAVMLAGQIPEEALQAIKAHNGERNGIMPSTRFDYALRCAETVTGLISAAAMVRPTKLEGLGAKSLKKKMKDKAFAAAVNREIIKECHQLGLDLDDFLEGAVASISSVADQVGLQ